MFAFKLLLCICPDGKDLHLGMNREQIGEMKLWYQKSCSEISEAEEEEVKVTCNWFVLRGEVVSWMYICKISNFLGHLVCLAHITMLVRRQSPFNQTQPKGCSCGIPCGYMSSFFLIVDNCGNDARENMDTLKRVPETYILYLLNNSLQQKLV